MSLLAIPQVDRSSQINLEDSLHVVVTARPSWARVKALVDSYLVSNGPDSLKILLVGPAVSGRYGDLTHQLSGSYQLESFSTLQESDSLPSVSLTASDSAATLSRYWSINRPRAVLFIADRTETLGVGLSASLMQIPLIHLQGGEQSGSIDDKVRNANSKLADYHLTTNESTRKNLINLGESENRIAIVGCPSIDLVRQIESDEYFLSKFPTQASEFGGVGDDFSLRSNFGIIMFHPDTSKVGETLNWLSRILHIKRRLHNQISSWFWFWPNPDYGSHEISAFIRRSREKNEFDNVRFIVNLKPETFIGLALKSKVLIGNSSFGIREASYIGLPTLNLGSRQNARQRGFNVTDLSTESNDDQRMEKFMELVSVGKTRRSNIYGDGRSGEHATNVINDWLTHPSIKI